MAGTQNNMTYIQIIRKNQKIAPINWWPCYAYHYTDVTNAVNILSTGKLYSRIRAQQAGLMKNDNASIQVINMTGNEATSYVRFYFRPLTPTQYYNEGFKHKKIRYDNDENANVPVPIFFLFDLDTLLNEEKICFSEQSQAGSGSPHLHGIDAFKNMPFSDIYGNGPCEAEKRKYRHAELLYPGEYDIANSLRYILCRNSVEKRTLLTLLKHESHQAYQYYKGYVRVAKSSTFQNNGLFVSDVFCDGKTMKISFSDTYEKKSYTSKQMQKNNCSELEPIEIDVSFRWLLNDRIIGQKSYSCPVDYDKPPELVFREIPRYERATSMMVSIYIEGSIAYCVELPIHTSELM